MYEAKDTNLNDLEKRSFYSFVALYLFSSFLFVVLSGYWYYSAQKNSLENETYYELSHIADELSGLIINAQMKSKVLQLPNEKNFEYTLVPTDGATVYKAGYFEKNGYKILVSDAPQEHLNIQYVVVKTNLYFKKLYRLKIKVLSMMSIGFFFIIIIFIILAKLFMKPMHKRIEMIESFIQDVSHELNTPVTALGMSASRAIKKGVFDKKILTNITISIKQLEGISKSLAFLNFKQTGEEKQELNLKNILVRTVQYYTELTQAKKINIVMHLDDVSFMIAPARAELLFSNLLSNAIKYSMPESTITIQLNKNSCTIEDEGVGIAKNKLDEIFKIYTRASDIAGGFGVGLSIVKQICDEYDINIMVDSKLGKGTKFILVFKKQ